MKITITWLSGAITIMTVNKIQYMKGGVEIEDSKGWISQYKTGEFKSIEI